MSDYVPNEAEKLLIAALRSGEYRQAMSHLRREERFCCLGVACDLFAKSTERGSWDENAFEHEDGVSVVYLPRPVMDWLGWKTDCGTTSTGGILACMNDDGIEFDHIADVIERGEVLRADPSE